jgi:Holliday junction resolvasome RuvABC endonuclease subunit
MPTKSFDGGLEEGHLVAIGIDQSLTGFAFTALAIPDPKQYMTWVYKSPYFGVERLVDIRQFLFDHLDYVSEDHAIDKIAMEGTVLASHSALVLGELSALVKLTIYDYFDDDTRFPVMVPPMTLKKYAAGKGNAKKQEMLLQMYKRWGIEFNDDNAADSYALARLAAGIHTDKVEESVVKQMQDLKYRDQSRD